MALRKPSDLFIKKEISGVFGSPEISTEITESYGRFRDNFDKVNNLSEKVEQLSQQLSEKLTKNDLENAMLSQLMVLDENFKSLQNQVKGLNKEDLREFRTKVSSLTEIVEELVEKELPKYKKQITSNEIRVGTQFDDFKEEIKEEIEEKIVKFYDILKEFDDVVQVIEVVSNIENYIQEHHSDIVTLREEVFEEIKQIPVGNIQENLERLEKKIDYIRETYSQIEPESVAREIIQEGLLNIPPEEKTSDPLSPLNQNFVTLDQLQEHYRLFINRIQQQLATFGGGGETKLKYLDDIVGIATNAASYDGKFLKYDHTISKFVFDNVGESQTLDNTLQLGNTSALGMSVGVVTATDFNSASDIKLKENVSVIDNPLDKIIRLEGVNFQWKETGKKSLGVIAQEVEKILPELVSGDDNKSVNYNGLVGLLIECVKQQQAEIEELKKYIDK